MATQLTFAYPGDLNTLTGGYLYDKRVIQGLLTLGWSVHPLALGDGFPWPSAATLDRAIEQLMAVSTEQLLVIDGLALGSFGARVNALAQRHPFIALVHHPLAKESGLTDQQAQALYHSEQPTLEQARHIVVTSQTTADTLVTEYGVAAHKVSVVIPGLDRPTQTARLSSPKTDTIKLLSVGALVPRKGFDVLLSALHQLTDVNWSLTIVGDSTRDPQTSAAITAQIHALGLGNRVTLAGAVSPETLAGFYQRADVFVLASHYEGYGMAFAEALAWGLPVIGTTGGAVAKTVPADSGLLVEPGQPNALAHALTQVLKDPIKRNAMRLAARHHGQRMPTWQDTANSFAQALSAP